jgi:glycosyltransferase involved in cell wall biosynthesis
VEWFTASFRGASETELIDGVRVVRKGRQWTVHLRAFLHYRGRLRGRFDAVIDEVNTIPFFTPLWARIPAVMLIWQLAREVWWFESRLPLNAVGYALEPLYLRVYRKTPVLTYSESTKSDLRALGFRSSVAVLPVGIDQNGWPTAPKSDAPIFIYVGRVSPSKRVHEIIEAFARFREQAGSGRLFVIGDGPDDYRETLDQAALRLGVASNVEFCGWLQGPEKYRRMAGAYALLMASVREGWGLVVTECNACRTPAIVYDVPGLRDSVRNGQTGLVVAASPKALAEGMLRLVADKELYRALQQGGLQWAKTLTHDASASAARCALDEAVPGVVRQQPILRDTALTK